MRKYYINLNSNTEGFHELHEEDCSWITLMEDPFFIGYYDSIEVAIIEAQKYFKNIIPCHSCNMVCSVA